MKKINLRLNVTEEERNLIRRAAALRNFRSMADFCRFVVVTEATEIEYKDKVERGREDIKAGRFVEHEEIEKSLDEASTES